jgi:predicted RNA-binding Zn-ribbon protein involved in translation (DUF1610 family)
MTQKFKTIARFRDLPIAELAKSKLESDDIPCFLVDKNLIGINWLYSFALGGIRLQVRNEDAEKALKILRDDQAEELSKFEAEFPAVEQSDVCEKCGSSDIIMTKGSRKAGALSLLLGFPFVFFRKRYKCRKCGHTMKPKHT